MLGRWTWFKCPSHVYARLRSGAALATYRKLLHKTMLTTREFLRQGVLTREEVGINDEVGYVFTHDAAASYRLVLVSHGKAKQFAAEVHARGLGAPIIDDAVIEEHSAPVKQVQSPSLCPFFAGSSPIVCALDDD